MTAHPWIQRAARDLLMSRLGQFPVVALLGARQVGKTTLARMVADRWPGEALRLDLESPTDLTRLEEPELYLPLHRDKLVVLDEVQRLPELFSVLRVLVDADRRPGRFLLLGSASPDLMRNASESLAGRLAFVELSPFDVREVTDWQRLWLRGGFPEAYLARDDGLASVWLESFAATFVERDLPTLGFRIPAMTFRRFLEMLAHLHGQVLNAARLGANFAVSGHTVRHYLDILEGTFLVRCLQPYHSNLGKRLVKSPKVYLRDSGLLHSLLRVESMEQLHGHPCIGASYEGWAIEQVCVCLAGSAVRPYFFRTHAGAEIDLLLDLGAERIAVEAKRSLAPKPSRGFHEAASDLDCSRRYVVYPGDERFPVSKTVEAIGIHELVAEVSELVAHNRAPTP